MTTVGVERRRLFDADFTRWYASRSISVAGTAASAVALPLLVYRTSASPTLTAAVIGLEALPYLLFGLFAGAAADRLNRRRMMVAADLACALMLASVPVADLLGVLTPWHVLAVAFGVGWGFCWFDSAAWGAFFRIVGKSGLTRANSIVWSTEVILEIAAPAAAGLLAAAADPSAVLAVDAATYLVSAALLTGLRTDLATAAPGTRRRLRAEIAEGWRHLWGMPIVRTLTAAGFGLNVAVGGVLGLLIVHADRALGVDSADRRIGLLYAAGAVGSLIAALALPRVSRRFGQGAVSIGGFAIFVLAVAWLAGTATFVGALLAWAVWSVARLLVNANGITVRQLLTPDELQGRVNTTGRMVAWGGTPFGALLGGIAADAYGVRIAYLLLAVPALIGLAALLASPVRGLRLETD